MVRFAVYIILLLSLKSNAQNDPTIWTNNSRIEYTKRSAKGDSIWDLHLYGVNENVEDFFRGERKIFRGVTQIRNSCVKHDIRFEESTIEDFYMNLNCDSLQVWFRECFIGRISITATGFASKESQDIFKNSNGLGVYRSTTGVVIVNLSNFYGDSGITGSTLTGYFSFGRCKFLKEATFSHNTFAGPTSWYYCEFRDNVDFSSSVFRGQLSFTGSKFHLSPSFDRVQLPDTLYFDNVDLTELKSDVYLSNGKLDVLKKSRGEEAKVTIFLDRSNIDKIRLDYSKFRLGFSDSLTHEEKVSIFQQVISKCQSDGLESSARGFDIDLQRMNIRNKYSKLYGFAYIVDFFQDYWWGFGYERAKIFRNICIAFAICVLYTFIMFKSITDAYFPTEQLGMSQKRANSLIFTRSKRQFYVARLKLSIYYTALIFFGWKLDFSKVQFLKNYSMSLAVLLIYTVGIVHLAYLAAFVLS